jgi:hypothetical protein
MPQLQKPFMDEEKQRKLEAAGAITPATSEKITQQRNSILDSAISATEDQKRAMELQNKQAEYEARRADLEAKVQQDLTKEPGFFTGARLTPEAVKAKYQKDADSIERLGREVGVADANTQPAQPAIQPASMQQTTMMEPQTGMQFSPQMITPSPMPVMPPSEGFADQQSGVALQMKAADIAGKEKAASLKSMQDTILKGDQERARIEQDKIDYTNTELAKIRDEQDKLAGMIVDPNRYVNSLSTWQKVGAAIATGLMRASGNTRAGNIITDAIEKDIAMQQSSIDSSRKAVGDKINLFERNLKKFDDVKLAKAATLDTLLNVAKLKIEESAAKAGSLEQKGKLLALAGDVQIKRDQAQQTMAEQIAKQAEPMAAMTKEDRERFVPGYGLAAGKEDATTLKTDLAAKEAAKASINRLIEINEDSGRFSGPQLRAEAESIALQMQGVLRSQILGPGAVTESERALLEKIIANPTSMFSLPGAVKTKLTTLINTMERNFNAKVKAFGLQTREDRVGFREDK